MTPTPGMDLPPPSDDLRPTLDRLRDLAAELRRAEDRDRKSLATALHDKLVQCLVISRMKLGLLTGQLTTPQSIRTLAEAKQFLDEAIQHARGTISDLRPMLFGNAEDLQAAIAWVVEKMERQGLTVRVDDTDEQKTMDEDTLVLAYQAIQELLTNVLKHAQTKEASLLVRRSDERLDISVTDCGKGFHTSTLDDRTRCSGFGLVGIRERLTLVGGRLELTSDPDKGTCAHLLIPLR